MWSQKKKERSPHRRKRKYNKKDDDKLQEKTISSEADAPDEEDIKDGSDGDSSFDKDSVKNGDVGNQNDSDSSVDEDTNKNGGDGNERQRTATNENDGDSSIQEDTIKAVAVDLEITGSTASNSAPSLKQDTNGPKADNQLGEVATNDINGAIGNNLEEGHVTNGRDSSNSCNDDTNKTAGVELELPKTGSVTNELQKKVTVEVSCEGSLHEDTVRDGGVEMELPKTIMVQGSPHDDTKMTGSVTNELPKTVTVEVSCEGSLHEDTVRDGGVGMELPKTITIQGSPDADTKMTGSVTNELQNEGTNKDVVGEVEKTVTNGHNSEIEE